MSKLVTVALIVALVASSVIAIAPVQAKLPKPIVPEFSVNYIDNSHDVEANTTIDPQTGKPCLLEAGYHIENNSVGLVIKNQQFTPYYAENGNLVELYYNIQFKGHLESDWHQVREDAVSGNNYILCLPLYLPSTDSEYTCDYFIVRTHYLDFAEESRYIFTVGNDPILNFTSGDQVDFQVMALIGYYTQFSDGMTPFGEAHHYIFSGENSEWSNTQTVTIGESYKATNPSLSPSPSPTSSEIHITAILSLIIVLALIATVLFHKRRKQT